MHRILLSGILILLPLSFQAQAATIEDCWNDFYQYEICWDDITEDTEPTVSCSRTKGGGYTIVLERLHEDGGGNTRLSMSAASSNRCITSVQGRVVGFDLGSCPSLTTVKTLSLKKDKSRLKKEMKAVCAELSD